MAIKVSGTTIINDTTAYLNLATTGGVKLPVGTTAQQPGSVTGILRWNSTEGAMEVYDPVNASYKPVAGTI